MAAILGKKIGMTSIYDDKGKVIPCTVVEAGPCYVSQVKTKDKEGVDAYQLAFDEKPDKQARKPEKGHFAKAGLKPTYFVVDFSKEVIGSELALGEKVDVASFKEGDKVGVIGTSKGKGFAGVVKRHHFGGGSKTHGQSDRLRAPGSVGGSSFPSRTFKGQRMAGRMGTDRVTVKNLEIVKIVPDSNLIVLRGAVPGKREGYVRIVSAK